MGPGGGCTESHHRWGTPPSMSRSQLHRPMQSPHLLGLRQKPRSPQGRAPLSRLIGRSALPQPRPSKNICPKSPPHPAMNELPAALELTASCLRAESPQRVIPHSDPQTSDTQLPYNATVGPAPELLNKDWGLVNLVAQAVPVTRVDTTGSSFRPQTATARPLTATAYPSNLGHNPEGWNVLRLLNNNRIHSSLRIHNHPKGLTHTGLDVFYLNEPDYDEDI